MKYKYFISYSYIDEENIEGFNNIELHLNQPISNINDVQYLESVIVDEIGKMGIEIDEVKILNFIPFGIEPVASENVN